MLFNLHIKKAQSARNALKRKRGRSPIVWILLATAVVLGAGTVWRKYVHYHMFPKRWRTVYSGQLYRSGQLSESLVKRVLKDHEIAVVVDLSGEDRNSADQNAELIACQELGIEHNRFALSGDGTGDIRHFAAAITCIADAVRKRKPVLVHCAAGIHRTGGVVAAYQVLVRHETPDSIYTDLTEHGIWKTPVNSIVIPFLNGHMKELAEELVRLGTIKDVPFPMPRISPLDESGTRTASRSTSQKLQETPLRKKIETSN